MCRFIVLKEGNLSVPIPVDEVVRFEAMSSYTNVYLKNGRIHRQCGHIGYWEEKVKKTALFLRVHKSHLVNSQYIISFSKAGVFLKDNSSMDISAQGHINLQIFFADPF